MFRSCSVEGCEKQLLAKGFCRSHYRQYHAVLCSIDGCNKSHDARGYCKHHYDKWKRFGDANFVFIRPINVCSINACKNKYKASGFCNIHYKSFMRLGHPLASSVKYNSCSIANCEREVTCKGLCHKHYYRFKAGLNLTEKTTFELTLEERIKANIDIIENTNCWNWMGAKACHGYGCINYNYKTQRVHRLSYTTFVGLIPDGMSVCHRCDNKLCCNPEHLFLGTHQDNMKDMIEKRRAHFQKKEIKN